MTLEKVQKEILDVQKWLDENSNGRGFKRYDPSHLWQKNELCRLIGIKEQWIGCRAPPPSNWTALLDEGSILSHSVFFFNLPKNP